MNILTAPLLFTLTGVAEILGCYLIFSWLRLEKSPLLLIPAAMSLALFAWLLTLHPTAAGRTYAAYGGIYIGVALMWLWAVEGLRPDRWDILGTAICLLGACIIYFGPRNG